jgi:hypothetical protein
MKTAFPQSRSAAQTFPSDACPLRWLDASGMHQWTDSGLFVHHLYHKLLTRLE